MHHISETDLPGIGQKFTFHTSKGDVISVIVYHTGHREIYRGEKTPSSLLELTEEESRAVAGILSGAYFPLTITPSEREKSGS